MKTAISVPDPVFEAAEALANRLGISRSELFTTAVSRYIETFNDEMITRALNEVYAEGVELVDPVLMQMQLHVLPDEGW